MRAESGQAFFDAVCRRIAAAKELRAVDIADHKGGINNWSSVNEYRAFHEASVVAARTASFAGRIFVMKHLEPLDSVPLRQLLHDELSAGIKLGIATDDFVNASGLLVDDFILIDDDFGFRLGKDEFDAGILTLTRNLIPRNELPTYHEYFNALMSATGIHHLSTTRDLDELVPHK